MDVPAHEEAEGMLIENEVKPAVRPKYAAKRKPLFAAPVKRQIIRGVDLISGKKKRGKK